MTNIRVRKKKEKNNKEKNNREILRDMRRKLKKIKTIKLCVLINS